jgi:hypothetical protein
MAQLEIILLTDEGNEKYGFFLPDREEVYEKVATLADIAQAFADQLRATQKEVDERWL